MHRPSAFDRALGVHAIVPHDQRLHSQDQEPCADNCTNPIDCQFYQARGNVYSALAANAKYIPVTRGSDAQAPKAVRPGSKYFTNTLKLPLG